MRVTRRTDRRLIVEDRPILISALLGLFLLGTLTASVIALSVSQYFVALIFALFCTFVALFFALFVRRVQVIFDRGAGLITFRARTLRRYSEVVHPFADFSHAICEGYDTRRCVLVFGTGMSAGHHPLTAYLTNGKGPMRITKAINDWLRDTAPVDSEGPTA